MSTRRRREHESSSRRETFRIWAPAESDSDHRPRQTMTTSQRPNVEQAIPTGHEKHHRSKRADPSGDPPPSTSYTHHRTASKEQAHPTVPSSSFYSVSQAQTQLLQNTAPLVDANHPTNSSSRSRTKETPKETYSLRTYLKRKTEKRSSPSSDGKLLAAEHARATRSNTQPRDGYQSADAAPLAPASTQTYWIPPDQNPSQATSSRQRERDKERDRERRHAEKARLKEEERARRKAEERTKLMEEDRARERAAEADRERRREKEAEHERRRQEKEREKERSGKHRDREKPRERGDGRREETRYPEYVSGYPQSHTTNGVSRPRWAGPDDRISTRQPYSDQIPSSSSNIALPMQQPGTTQPTRPPASSTEPSRATHPHASNGVGHEKRHHRSHRDKVPLHNSTQESGMSSSEQESGRERTSRIAERKRNTGNNTGGPSGSESERTARERRKHHRPHEPDQLVQARSTAEQKPPVATAPSYPSAPQTVQAAPLVGPTTAQYKPQIVSIRAGQGPSDHPGPVVPPKTPAPDANIGRSYGTQQELNPRSQPVSSSTQMAYLQVPPELYGSARAANAIQVQNGYIHSQSNPQQPSTAIPPSHHPPPGQPSQWRPTYGGLNVSATPLLLQHPSDVIVRPPSAAPIPPVKQSAYMPAPVQSHTIPPPLPAKSHIAPSPRRQVQSLPVQPKGDHSLTIPQKGEVPVPTSAPPIAGTHFAKLSVYRAPDPPIAGELTFAALSSSTPANAINSQNHYLHSSSTYGQDPSSRFPLNEEALVTVTSTRHTQPTTGPAPPRSATFPPPSNGTHVLPPHAVPPSPMQTPTNRPYPMPGDDTPRAAPIPIPAPRSMATFAQADPTPTSTQNVANSQPYDPRSPKHALSTPAPILSSTPFQATRPQVSPLQHKPQGLPQPNVTSAATVPDMSDHRLSRPPQPNVAPPGAGAGAATIANPSSHSPSRSTQLNIARASPGAASTSLTPKHSPSGRMHLRNGSNDTISQSVVPKHSPSSGREKNLTQKASVTNMQPSHAASRPDMTPPHSRQPPAVASAGYPESVRYRPALQSQSQSQSQAQYPFLSSAQQAPVSIPATQPLSAYSNVAHTSYPAPRLNMQSTPAPTTLHNASQFDPNGLQRAQPTPTPQAPSASQGISSASAIAAAYRSGTYHSAEMASRPPDPPASSRVPPRSAPSPAPTGAGRQYHSVSSSVTKIAHGSAPLMSPQPVRGQTFPTTANVRSSTAIPTTSHSRSASDPYYGITQSSRVPVAGHPSTPAPPKPVLEALRISSSPVEPEQLRTPSSLAQSMSRHNSFAPSIAPSITPSKEKESRMKGFFGRFRSKSSPPKHIEVRPPVAPKTAGAQPRPRASSQTTIQAVATSVKNIITPHPTNIHAPTPIVAPTPLVPSAHVDPASGRRSPGSKMFTSFRLISKRHRTVSSASVEAMDGTAPNTVIGGESTRSSTAGRPSPPLRDPVTATFDWRNREEAGQMAKGQRRYRPGVTFEMEDDVIDEAFGSRPPVRRSSRRYDTK